MLAKMPGVVVHGTAIIEWLKGERFLILRSRNEHPDFPDAISMDTPTVIAPKAQQTSSRCACTTTTRAACTATTTRASMPNGALAVRLPKHARKELEAFLDCGLLCRGFARLRCASCEHSQLVAFSCKGRGFCPSCMGRRMRAMSANLMERILPERDLRQWVLTFPFACRRRLAQDGALLSTLTRLFVDSVHSFYAKRAAAPSGALASAAKSGAATVDAGAGGSGALTPFGFFPGSCQSCTTSALYSSVN